MLPFVFKTKKSSGGAGGGLTFAEEVSGRKRKIQQPVDRFLDEDVKKGQ
jgi:hypothetical protein